MQLEVDALEQAVGAAGLDTFHLVGYSGGGAVSLAFAAQHPERLWSLTMFEPANVPGRGSPTTIPNWPQAGRPSRRDARRVHPATASTGRRAARPAPGTRA